MKKENAYELCVENCNSLFPKRERSLKSSFFCLIFSGCSKA